MPAWTDVVLCEDADLTAQESSMPDLAKSQTSGGGASRTPYDSKRALAKKQIESVIRRRGILPDSLLDPGELRQAAVYLELSLIFQDMGGRGEAIALDKSQLYRGLYEDEVRDLVLSYNEDAPEPPAVAGVRMRTVRVSRS